MLIVVEVNHVDEWDVVLFEVLFVLFHHVIQMFFFLVLRCLRNGPCGYGARCARS